MISGREQELTEEVTALRMIVKGLTRENAELKIKLEEALTELPIVYPMPPAPELPGACL